MRGLILLLSAVFLSGCASVHVPKDAFLEPSKTVSRPHPRELEKSKVTSITRLTVIHSPKLLTESTAVAISGSVDFADFFPAMAIDANTGKKLAEGRTEFVSGTMKLASSHGEERLIQALPMLPNGVLTANLELYLPREELENALLFYTSHDGQRLFNSAGIEVFEELEVETDDQKSVEYSPFDPKKFEHDKDYRLQFKKQALTLPQHEQAWQKYAEYFGLEPKPTVSIIVGQGEAWSSYKQYLYAAFPQTYETPSNEWRIGKVDIKTYNRIANREPGFTSGKRVIRDLVLPASSLVAFTGIGALTAGVQFAGQVTASSMNLNIEGLYGSASTLRQDMSPVFVVMQDLNRLQLEQQMLRSANLERENALLQQQIQVLTEQFVEVVPLPEPEGTKPVTKIAVNNNPR